MVELTVNLAEVWHAMQSAKRKVAGLSADDVSAAVWRSMAVAFAALEKCALQKAMRKNK